MKKHIVNGVVYSEEEWRRNQMGLFFAEVISVVVFFLMIIFIR